MLRQSLLQAKVISFIGKHFSFLFPSMSFASVLSLSFLSISLSSSRLSGLPSPSSPLCLSHSCPSLSISLCLVLPIIMESDVGPGGALVPLRGVGWWLCVCVCVPVVCCGLSWCV